MGSVEFILALFDGGLILCDRLFQRRGVRPDGGGQLGTGCAFHYDALCFPLSVFRALCYLRVGEA